MNIYLSSKYYFRVPTEENAKKKWILAIETHQQFDYTVENFFVCEKHFKPSDVIVCDRKKILVRGSIPTVFIIGK